MGANWNVILRLCFHPRIGLASSYTHVYSKLLFGIVGHIWKHGLAAIYEYELIFQSFFGFRGILSVFCLIFNLDIDYTLITVRHICHFSLQASLRVSV